MWQGKWPSGWPLEASNLFSLPYHPCHRKETFFFGSCMSISGRTLVHLGWHVHPWDYQGHESCSSSAPYHMGEGCPWEWDNNRWKELSTGTLQPVLNFERSDQYILAKRKGEACLCGEKTIFKAGVWELCTLPCSGREPVLTTEDQ